MHSGVNGLYAEIIGQLAVRHRVRRAWAYRIYNEIIDLRFRSFFILCLFSAFLCDMETPSTGLSVWPDDNLHDRSR